MPWRVSFLLENLISKVRGELYNKNYQKFKEVEKLKFQSLILIKLRKVDIPFNNYGGRNKPSSSSVS